MRPLSARTARLYRSRHPGGEHRHAASPAAGGPLAMAGALRPVAADAHRAPLAPAGARAIVERPAAVGVRARLQARPGAVETGGEDDAQHEREGGVGSVAGDVERARVGAEARGEAGARRDVARDAVERRL